MEVMRAALAFEHPADAVLSRYFQQHHALGQHDRAFIAETVFGVLRRKRTLDRLTQEGDARRLVLAWLVRFSGLSARELSPVLEGGEAEWLAGLKALSLE